MTPASAIALPASPLERAGAVAPVEDGQAFSVALTDAALQAAPQPQQPVSLVPPQSAGMRLAAPGLLAIPDLGEVSSAPTEASVVPAGVSAPSDTNAPDIVKAQVAVATLPSSIGPLGRDAPAAPASADVSDVPEAVPPADPRAVMAAGVQSKPPAGQAAARKSPVEISAQAQADERDAGEPSGTTETASSSSGSQAGNPVIPEAVPSQAKAVHSDKGHGKNKQGREEEPSSVALPAAEPGAAPPAAQGVQPGRQVARERQVPGDPGAGFSQPLAATAHRGGHTSAFPDQPAVDVVSVQVPGEQTAPMPARSDLPIPGPDKPISGGFALHPQHSPRADVPPAVFEQSAAAVISARQGIGKSLGLEIARTMASGQEQIVVRLDPKDLGQLDIRLSFDPAGELRAVVTTTTTASADIIRQDLPSLLRGLSDAGVRVDDKSIRFELQSDTHSGSGQGQSHTGGQSSRRGTGGNEQRQDEEAMYGMRPWRAGGQFELRA